VYLERAYRLNNQDGDILYNYGLLLYLLDRWEEAAEIFKEYLELFPDDREVLKKAGDSCYLNRDYASAAKAYQRLTKEAGES